MIEVHQALHGYSRGHRLLATSAKYSRDVGYLMGVASDLSGPPHQEFRDGYLTGYGVPSDGLYVLARTWPAQEMPRPGCVWTHSLIFDVSQIPKIVGVEQLLDVFRCPEDMDFAHYATPVTLMMDRSSSGRVPAAEVGLLRALYAQPLPVLMPIADDHAEQERMILNIWQHQWPRLRRSFYFCTGSLADRRGPTGIAFDLQVVPADRVARIERAGDFVTPVESAATSDSEVEKSLDFLAKDLSSAYPPTELSKFLGRYGAEIESGRSACLRIVRVYREITERRDLSSAVRAVDEVHHGDVGRLRRDLFSEESVFPFPEEETLEFLSTDVSLPDSERLLATAAERADRFFAGGVPPLLMSRMLRATLSPFGAEVLASASRHISSTELAEVEKLVPGSAIAFVEANPGLAEREELWSMFANQQEELLDAVQASASSFTPRVMHAILGGLGSRRVPTNLVGVVGRTAVHALLELPRSSVEGVPPEWLASLRKRGSDVADWLEHAKSCTHTQWALVTSVRPDEVYSVSSSAWERLLCAERLEPDSASVSLAAWLGAIGFAGKGCPRLLVTSFRTLEEAVSQDDLDYAAWAALSRVLPQIEIWKQWDKCERLRRGLVRAWIVSEWDPELFLKAARESLSEVLKSSRKVKRGRKFCRRILELPKSVLSELTESQLRSLKRAARG